MKGMVFTEFIEFVEDRFGLEEVDKMIAESDSNGSYTSVGTYPHEELVGMLVALSGSTKLSIAALLQEFGRHLFGYLATSYPAVLGNAEDAFSLLQQIDNHIHVEVRKLYPDSELPEFRHEMVGNDEMKLTYQSDRGLADLAEGLLLGCFAHFGQPVEIEREDLSDGRCQHVRFDIRKVT